MFLTLHRDKYRARPDSWRGKVTSYSYLTITWSSTIRPNFMSYTLVECLKKKKVWRKSPGAKLCALTQSANGVLTLFDLLGHHSADAHQTLSDVTGCLRQALLGGLPTITYIKWSVSVSQLGDTETTYEWERKAFFQKIFPQLVLWWWRWWWRRWLTVLSKKICSNLSHRGG